jgi:calcium-dependent protein kinase|mmetsp:Transcript_119255/g.187082  ORF Transcript_119255/g.187082 Transcript_119255/m.187082 type:complete len:502 (+) Transcript_119255:70-1575(+)|eukprot:CAMPEP_0169100362 /NCGR_PEP_ID=MMETSP1015-20121227/21046_1 /TAXON_ID=342587 /ORGANISM="Karlodinium micrum, Strain CCMP2283" /LENGTH=501 /DNA_ID=CAMNT_0009161297 /DNA_START=69 /DNA_END=1574 /DNA_ORIENTATION=+
MSYHPTALDEKYEFEYDVGQWTFGSISVVRRRNTKDLYTCKKVPKTLVGNSSGVLAKLRQLQELQHPHIISVVEVLEDRSCFYILTEFMQGGEVSDWAERLMDGYVIQEQTIATYIRQVLMAMVHCNSANVFHGALLPSSLALTSKMPDAIVKVGDFGLAAILDPENSIAQRNHNPYTAPEIASGEYAFIDSNSDMYSIGAITHALLVGRAPGLGREKQPMMVSCWGGGRVDSQMWAERSSTSRDFVNHLTASWDERLSPARALQHPWLKGVQTVGASLDDAQTQEVRQKLLCCTLAILMVPNLLPYRDFEQLQTNFEQNDNDGDGLAPTHIVQRILRGRCAVKEAVDAAIKIADVQKSGVLDLCGTTCADVFAREFFAAGPTGQPLMGPFRATDLAPRMLKRFFEIFGGRQQHVTLSGLRAKLKTATATEVESHAGVKYDEILADFPRNQNIDSQMLTSLITANEGRGTPFDADEFASVKEVEPSFATSLGQFIQGMMPF